MTSRVSVVEVTGPLAGVADRFRMVLSEQGYAPLSAANQLRLLAHLSRWMSAERLEPADLCDAELARFLAVRRAAGYTRWLSLRGLQPLLRVLRAEGVLACVVVAVPSMVDVLVADFAGFLTVERGLAVSTVAGRVLVVRRFLDRVDVDGLAAGDVASYVATLSEVGAVGTVKLHLTGVRSLLRFLHMSGRVGLVRTAGGLTVSIAFVHASTEPGRDLAGLSADANGFAVLAHSDEPEGLVAGELFEGPLVDQ